MPKHTPDVEPLERRRLLAVTPAAPRADSVGDAFDAGERRALLDRLGNLSRAQKTQLAEKLARGPGAFDNALLAYMRSRGGPAFFFDPDDADDLGQFIRDKRVSYTDLLAHAEAVTESRLFPEQSGSRNYTVRLPAKIEWVSPAAGDNPETLHALNRHEWWREMSWVSAITGDAKYAREVEYELASWSRQFPTMRTPAAWSKGDRAGWLLDTAIRAESWTWAYFGFLEHPEFSAAENSLFLYKLLQTGDFLYESALTTEDLASNRTIVLAKGLHHLGTMFPEIDVGAEWRSAGRSLAFRCMDAQVYDDGSHVEQSPGYAFNVSDDLVDIRQLDRLNDVGWPKPQRLKLANIVDSYWQFLAPDGTRPAVGDTYRADSRGLFLKPSLVLESDRWLAAKPRVRDVFALGADAVEPYVNSPSVPDSLGPRGRAYAMPESGNYVMRSGDDADARQVVFDAGPKGGAHGHLDLLSFELTGFGRPLISDPGPYKYDTSPDRAYVVSTRAHNTLNADGRNIASLEGAGNADILVSQWRTGDDFAQVTTTHRGYKDMAGSPLLTRSLWYDLNGTILIVDWAEGTARHDYQQSFNLQTEGNADNVVVDPANLAARTRYADGGNVRIQSVVTDGVTAVKGPRTFVTNRAEGDFKDDAYRFRLNQSGKFVVFVTLVTAYDGTRPPDATATLLSDPAEGGTVKVRLVQGGKARQVDFSRPAVGPLGATAQSRGTFNDIAFDADDRLHLAYADRDTGALMYAARDRAGRWSAASVVDPAASPDAEGGYLHLSLAIDPAGHPAVAYFDGWNGDLRYAARDVAAGEWRVRTIDSRGSTGLYPSLAFGRDGRAAISFYNRTDGDLKLARQSANGRFSVDAIDTAGDVGRASQLLLDPNRRSVTRWTVAYEDTGRGDYRYAIEGDFDGGEQANGFTRYVVHDLPEGGGYASLAYYDTRAMSGRRYQPAVSYYDAGETALRFATSADSGATWASEVVASAGVQGLYCQLLFDADGTPGVWYFDRSNNEAVRAVRGRNGWTRTDLRAGGREIHVATNSAGAVAYSSLDVKRAVLSVHLL